MNIYAIFIVIFVPCLIQLTVTARKCNVGEDDKVLLSSLQGEIKVQIRLSERIPDNAVHMYTGWWAKHGNPNVLTPDISSEMGGQVAYHETFVEISKL